jgi:hypothetical protein
MTVSNEAELTTAEVDQVAILVFRALTSLQAAPAA